MSEGYTYTTIHAAPGEPVRVRVGFYLDREAWIRACGIGTGGPLLSVSHGNVDVTICLARPGEVTGWDVKLARTLADEAAKYAAEIERLAAGGGPGGTAA